LTGETDRADPLEDTLERAWARLLDVARGVHPQLNQRAEGTPVGSIARLAPCVLASSDGHRLVVGEIA
jgi:hypothetical protein